MTVGKGIFLGLFWLGFWIGMSDLNPEHKGKYWQPNPIESVVAEWIDKEFVKE